MKIKNIISYALCLLILLSFSHLFSYAPMTVKAEDDSALKGVDLSKWNGDVDFAKMKYRGIDFAILRCYSYYQDPTFITNYNNAVANSIPVGAYNYMYATNENSAANEAKAAMKVLDGRLLEYPFFLDVEDDTLKSLGREKLTKLCLIELKIFEEAGYNVGIYCSKSFFNTYLDPSQLTGYDRWVARWTYYAEDKTYYFSVQPSESSYKPECEMWQFSDAGDGRYYGTQSARLDMNYSYVDYAAKPDYCKSTDPAAYSFPSKTISVSAGNNASQVRWVQSVLYNLGYRVIAGGEYSPYVSSQIEAFQAANGLTVTGNVDASTAKALKYEYQRKAYTFKIKYKDSLSGSEIIEGTYPFASDFIITEHGFSAEGMNLVGWNVKRGSDQKWLSLDGSWQKKADAAASLAIIPTGTELTLDDVFCDSGAKKEVIAFYAVWEEAIPPKATCFVGDNRFDIYDERKKFPDASDYAAMKNGRLAVLSDKDVIDAVASALPNGDYLIGASNSASGWFWIDGSQVSDSSLLRGDYLVISKTADGYSFKGVSSIKKPDGFIVESKCRHLRSEKINERASTCTLKGYTGDVICSDCKTVLIAGSFIKRIPHTFGAYVVQAPATFKDNGSKAKICSVCGGRDVTVVSKIDSVTLNQNVFSCNGSVQVPKVSAFDADGKAIPSSSFTVTVDKKSKSPGVYSVTVKFSGSYSGKKTLKFSIVPAKVGNVSALKTAGTSIELKWAKSKGASFYKVEISEDGKTWKKVKTVKETNLNISKLQKGTRYFFRIRAYDTSKKLKSEYSSVFKTQTVTSAPSLTLKNTSSGVKVIISKVNGASKYIIYRSYDGQKWKKASTTTKLKCTVDGLKTGKKVFFKAVAVNAYDRKSDFGKIKSIVVR